jgi:Mrp family chromosome partitioning ATPase
MWRHRGNLAVLPAVGSRRNPAELLHSPQAAQALDRIEALYDPTLMLFDLPPIMVGDDVMAIAGHLDGVLLVAAAGSTTIAQIDVCERELAARTNVVGVVLNKCRYLDQDYGEGY